MSPPDGVHASQCSLPALSLLPKHVSTHTAPQVEPSYLALNRFKFDSQVAKVYLSVFSDAQGKSTAMDQLVRLQGCAAI